MNYNEEDMFCTDYKGRCGNCHSVLGPKDRYCRYCGTPVGEGKFKPYRNESYCVYGPPIKELWHCPDCGHTWRSTVLGGDNPEFCPKCGGRSLKKLESEVNSFSKGYFSTLNYEAVDLDHPAYLTQDEVETILNLRTDEPFDDKKAKKTLIEAGFEEVKKACEFDNMDDEDPIPEITGREAERINMELFILKHVKGQLADMAPKVNCPKCKGNMISVVLKEQKTSPDHPVEILSKGLYEEKMKRGGRYSGNYHCLLCNKYFD